MSEARIWDQSTISYDRLFTVSSGHCQPSFMGNPKSAMPQVDSPLDLELKEAQVSHAQFFETFYRYLGPLQMKVAMHSIGVFYVGYTASLMRHIVSRSVVLSLMICHVKVSTPNPRIIVNPHQSA